MNSEISGNSRLGHFCNNQSALTWKQVYEPTLEKRKVA